MNKPLRIPAPQTEPSFRFGAVIREGRKTKKLSQQDLANQLQVTRNTVINWENDRSRPDYALLPALCRILDLSLSALFGTEEKTPVLTAQEARVLANLRRVSPAGRRTVDRFLALLCEEESREKADRLKHAFALFPVRPGSVAAGTGSAVPSMPPEYVFLRRNAHSARADGIVRVSGDSMEPRYHDGEYVYYQTCESAAPGEDVIVDTDEGAVIKRVAPDHTLYSLNAALPYPEKNEQNTLEIRGRVLNTVAAGDYPAAEDEALLPELFADELRAFREKYGLDAWS